MNKCSRGATLDMSNTKLLVHSIGTVKSDLPQSTLQTQVESVGDVVDGMIVSAVNGRYWWWDEMDEDWVSCCADYVLFRCALSDTAHVCLDLVRECSLQ